MSKDRETTDSTSVGGGNNNAGSNLRFRNQSPSTNQRRSRERERIDKETNKDLSSGQSALNQSAEMTVDHMDFDDSRVTGK